MNNCKKSNGVTTIPCKWCGKPTTYLGTKMCNRCYELSDRIERDPELAKRMIKELGL